MYLSGGNALLSSAGNYVIWSARLGSPRYTVWNPAEQVQIKSYYIITRESLARKGIYGHLTRMLTVDKIVNVNASKAPFKAKN